MSAGAPVTFGLSRDQLDDRGVHAAVIMDLVGHDVVVPFDYLAANRIAGALGPLFPLILRILGIPRPKSREDLDFLAEMLLATGL